MTNFRTQICTALSLAATSSVALAQPTSSTDALVTVDNYIRAQSDVYFGLTVKTGAFGKFVHGRELTPIDKRGIIRPNQVRAALLQLGETISDTKHMFGANKNQVDPVRHLVGTTLVWGGLPEKDALYLPVTPARNDDTTIHKLTVKDVPVDGFWSITVYNADGYLEPNQYNAYSVNMITGKRGADGSVAIQFGGCDGEIPNCLPIMKGWNYTVRLFRPRPEILDGTWRFPEAQSVT